MRSDYISVDSRGNGFEDAVAEAGKTAAYNGLSEQDTMRMKLITEEMLSLVRMVTGEDRMSFWIESEGGTHQFHLTAETVMDADKRQDLILSASNRKNDAAGSLLGKLRDRYEQAMLAKPDRHEDIPQDFLNDVAYHPEDDPEWDRCERSVLRRLADDIRIGIRGGRVDMTVTKRFG